MQLAKVNGKVTCSKSHPSFANQKLLLCQPLGVDGQETGDPLIVVDHLGAGAGNLVMISSDSKRLRSLVGDDKTPIRWFILGVIDDQQ